MAPLIERYRAFAIDLDGVVWRGEWMLPGAIETLKRIQAMRKPILLLTNNGSYLPTEIHARLEREGIGRDGIDILTSVGVVFRWIESNGLGGATALVVAAEQVVTQLSSVLIVNESSDSVEVVIVGRDTRFDYSKLTVAADAIRSGAAFVALNRDLTMPVESGFVPGTGALVAAIEAASGVEPIVLGKPHAPMMDYAVQILGSEGVLMVGDRIDSDIAGAKSVGWDSALVLSGVDQPTDRVDPAPTHVIESLIALMTEVNH
jgi:HAD superfamily hydrolase (TIGR01450 family)